MALKILIVEDSVTVAAYVVSILGAEADVVMLPVASTAEAGVRMAREHSPNVILMDMKLPDHDGLWAIEQIMADAPCPVVVLSGYLSSRERNITFESLRAGAVDVLAKPSGLTVKERESFRHNLVSTVRLMSTAVVVRRNRPPQRLAARAPSASRSSPISARDLARVRYVMIGASTGGPELLYRTLAGLSAPAPFPLLITQHTLEGFDDSLAQWLSVTGHDVRLACQGDKPVPGRVYLAPAEMQMQITASGINLLRARRGESATSVDMMFESAAKTWGDQCMAAILSGMGRDGAAGMRALHDAGALTIAQSAETCVVSSMPDSARARLAVGHVLSPDELLSACKDLANNYGARPGDARRGR
jgi:two-component system, chemotaxis family, protein-glutamate methylesterase/glutaminase